MADKVAGEAKYDAFITKVRNWYRDSLSHQREWRLEAKQCFDMVAGRQFTDAEKAEIEESLRAPIVFNRIDPTVSAVQGHQINNRQEVRYLPREMGDVKLNEIYTAAAEYIDDNSDAYDEVSDAFWSALVCGMGWTETRIGYDEDPEGKVYGAEMIDYTEMKWDPRAKKRNLMDSRYLMRERFWPKDEAEMKWPKLKGMDIANQEAWIDSPDDLGEHDASRSWMYENSASQWYRKEEDEVLILLVQWYELENMYTFRDPQSGKLLDLPQNKYNKVKDQLDELGLKVVKRYRRKYYQAFICGDEVLEKGPSPCKDHFTMQCITGKRDLTKNHWYGLVRAMIDPQKWANKFFSEIQDIMSSNRTGGAFVEESALVNPREARDMWNDANPLILIRDGALGRGAIQERNPIQYPQGLDKLMEWAIIALPQVSGVNVELLGMVDREQAGILEIQRKKAGLTILSKLFDNLKSYRRQRGRLLLYFIETYLTDGRLIRITGQDGTEKYQPLMKDPQTKKYDIIVDESPSSPNQREETYAILSHVIPQLLQTGLPIPPEVLDYVPLPSTLIAKWKELINNNQNNPDVKKAKDLEARLKAAEAAKAETQAQLNEARAQLEKVKTKLAPHETAAKIIK